MGKNNLSLREKAIFLIPAKSGIHPFRLPPTPGKRKKVYLCAPCVSVVINALMNDRNLPYPLAASRVCDYMYENTYLVYKIFLLIFRKRG